MSGWFVKASWNYYSDWASLMASLGIVGYQIRAP